MDKPYLSAAEAAQMLCVSESTLKRWRQDPQHGLAWRRAGERRILYARADVEAFVTQPVAANS